MKVTHQDVEERNVYVLKGASGATFSVEVVTKYHDTMLDGMIVHRDKRNISVEGDMPQLVKAELSCCMKYGMWDAVARTIEEYRQCL